MSEDRHKCRTPKCPLASHSTCREHCGEACEESPCGLDTTAASQAATFLMFILTSVLWFMHEYHGPKPTKDPVLVCFVCFLSITTTAFYFLGLLVVEEQHTWQFRSLSRGTRIVEIVIRIICLLALAWGFFQGFRGGGLSGILTGLSFLYCLFVIWDIVLWLGSDWKKVKEDLGKERKAVRCLANSFLKYDLLQAVPVWVFWATYVHERRFHLFEAGVVLWVFAVLLVWMFKSQSGPMNILRRLLVFPDGWR